jgi:hypothetical protein
MTRYSIEAAIFKIPTPFSRRFTHNFWVLKEYDTNKTIAALHGLATSRTTGKILPIGYNKDHSLRAYHFNYDERLGDVEIIFLPQHLTQCVVVGEHVLEIWQKAVTALPLINQLDLDYPSLGFLFPLKTTINSNSVFHTLADVMNISLPSFKGYVQIGLENSLVDLINKNTMLSSSNE